MKDFLPEGRMISASKTGYISKHPTHLVAFNANVLTRSKGRIWHGDLDVTADAAELKTLAAEVGEELYILRESTMHHTDTPDLGLAIAIVSATAVTIPARV
jgi:hypothetical protein